MRYIFPVSLLNTQASQMVKWWRICPQFRRHKRCVFNPWVRKICWQRKWQLTSLFLPGESHRQRSLVGYSPWGSQRGGQDWSDWACTHKHFQCSRTSVPRGERMCFVLFYFFENVFYSLLCLQHNTLSGINVCWGISLVAQLLRICFPMSGTWVQSLLRELKIPYAVGQLSLHATTREPFLRPTKIPCAAAKTQCTQINSCF